MPPGGKGVRVKMHKARAFFVFLSVRRAVIDQTIEEQIEWKNLLNF